MIAASQLRPGIAVRFEGSLYKVLAANYHPGQGKMGGVCHARLKNLGTGTLREHNFRADLKLEEVSLDKRGLEFLYQDGEECLFLDPATNDTLGVPTAAIGSQIRFLRPELAVSIEFVGDQPVSVELPEMMEMRVGDTAPPVHQQNDSTWKPALLDNGVEVMVPQFIKTGDVIRIDLAKLAYMDRARPGGR